WALGRDALEVVFLPPLLDRARAGDPQRGVELGPAPGPLRVLRRDVRIVLEPAQLGTEGLQLPAPLRDQHAYRLPLVEDHGMVGAGHLPVDRERRGRPIGLDQALQREGALL